MDVLPAEEEAHQIRGAHRLDLAPERAEREPVDAREEPALAPLLVVGSGREAPAQRPAAALELGQADGDTGGREAHARGEPGGGDRSRDLEPAADDRAERLLLAV